MRYFLSIVSGVLLFANFVFADVTAEVLSYKIDDNGNIEVHTQYKIDGIEVQSRYPQEDGKFYWVTRYSSYNFGDMTNEQIQQRILKEVESHTEALIRQNFINKQNQDIIENRLGTLKGTKVLKNQSEFNVDSDGDNITDETWVVDDKGNKISEKPFIPNN